MSNWQFLNAHRINNGGPYSSVDTCGFNGMFEFIIEKTPVRVISSNGYDWEHVSVSIIGSRKPPKWDVMCAIKDLFWDEETPVMQLHPPKSMYVNFHPGCLHLWRPTRPGVLIPLPDPIMVGPKGIIDRQFMGCYEKEFQKTSYT